MMNVPLFGPVTQLCWVGQTTEPHGDKAAFSSFIIQIINRSSFILPRMMTQAPLELMTSTNGMKVKYEFTSFFAFNLIHKRDREVRMN